MELYYETSDGAAISAFGSLSPNGRNRTLSFTKSNGDLGDILLRRGFGSGTFFPELIAGDYDVELVDPFFPTPRTGFIHVSDSGFIFAGAIDGIAVIGGNVTIVDDPVFTEDKLPGGHTRLST